MAQFNLLVCHNPREGLWYSNGVLNNHHNQLRPRDFGRHEGAHSKSLPRQLQTALFKELRRQHGQQKITGPSCAKWWLTKQFPARPLEEQCKALASTSPPSSHRTTRISCFKYHSEYVISQVPEPTVAPHWAKSSLYKKHTVYRISMHLWWLTDYLKFKLFHINHSLSAHHIPTLVFPHPSSRPHLVIHSHLQAKTPKVLSSIGI